MTTASRRKFLASISAAASATGLVSLATRAPGFLLESAAIGGEQPRGERVLVVIQLSGGNDGLNTVVPYADEVYRRRRPSLALSADQLLKIDREIGLHSSLKGLASLLEKRQLGIVQGVGYPNPNRSHFESMDIWHTCARKEDRKGSGWLGRMIADCPSNEAGDSLGIHLGHEQQPLALSCPGVQVPSFDSIEQFRLKVDDDGLLKEQAMESRSNEQGNDLLDFLQSSTESALSASARIADALTDADAGGEFPDSQLGQKLRTVSRLILSGLSTKVYYVTLDGFDTHSLQPLAHESLLRQWSDALEAFVNRLEQAGQADRVLAMTFSEFGRRVAENASEGTDHGAAAPLFFAGAKLPRAIVGEHPSLSDLDDGDLKFHTDFRCVYATVLEKWFQTPSHQILGEEYPRLELI